MQVLFATLLFAACVAYAAAARPGANCTAARIKSVEECTLPGQIFGNYDKVLPPKNGGELLSMCKNIRYAGECGTEYAKDCLSGVSSTIFGLVMKNFKSQAREKCSRTGRKAFYGHMQCLKPENAKTLHDCLTIQSLRIQYIADDATLDPDHLIPALCCSSYPTFECLKREGTKHCEGAVKNAAETGDFVSDWARAITGDAMELFCTSFSNEETCRAQLPHVMKKYDQIEREFRNGTAPKPRSYAFALPMIEVFQRPDF